MANYSGAKEEQLEKRRAYDKKRNANPAYRGLQRLKRQTPEYKARVRENLKKYRRTEA